MITHTSAERIRRACDLAILVATLLIANRWTWLCVFEINKPLFWCQYGTPVSELAVYIAIAGMVTALLWRAPIGRIWIQLWRKNVLLLLFLAWAAASTFWSIAPVSTVYRVLVALLSAVVASYLGMRFSEAQWIRRLSWFFGVTIVLSYLLVWLLPGAAIMQAPGLEGSWRGVFSHRNYGGSILAYGAGTILLSMWMNHRPAARILLGVILAADAILIYFTGSATGAILLLLLIFLVLAGVAWQHFRDLLHRWHYATAAGAVTVALVMILTNLDQLLGLLGRNSTLTGRVPVWRYLIDRVREHNLILGYGFWTFWRFQNLRREVQAAVRWPFEVIDAHNGFIDVLLFLGVVGLGLLVVLIARALAQAGTHTVAARTTESLWPALTLVYVVAANITISFFFQFETFHWVLLVASIFSVTAARERNAASLAITNERAAAINA